MVNWTKLQSPLLSWLSNIIDASRPQFTSVTHASCRRFQHWFSVLCLWPRSFNDEFKWDNISLLVLLVFLLFFPRGNAQPRGLRHVHTHIYSIALPLLFRTFRHANGICFLIFCRWDNLMCTEKDCMSLVTQLMKAERSFRLEPIRLQNQCFFHRQLALADLLKPRCGGGHHIRSMKEWGRAFEAMQSSGKLDVGSLLTVNFICILITSVFEIRS